MWGKNKVRILRINSAAKEPRWFAIKKSIYLYNYFLNSYVLMFEILTNIHISFHILFHFLVSCTLRFILSASNGSPEGTNLLLVGFFLLSLDCNCLANRIPTVSIDRVTTNTNINNHGLQVFPLFFSSNSSFDLLCFAVVLRIICRRTAFFSSLSSTVFSSELSSSDAVCFIFL